MRTRGRSTLAVWAAAFLVICCYLLYRTPDPSYFLADGDGGTFIQGASQFLRAGELPQFNYFSSYGPLSYALRALVMAGFGDRILSEVLFATLSFGLAYALMGFVSWRISGSAVCALLVVVIAALCMPRYYKSFVVLVPAGMALLLLLYADRPTLRRAALLGVGVGIATLFRQDYGAYAFAAALVALLVSERASPGGRWRALAAFLLGGSVIGGPWIVALLANGTLHNYLRTVFQVSAAQAEGFSLPHPLLHWTGPASLVFLAVYALPVVTAVTVAASWRSVTAAERSAFSALVVLASLCLLQSAHRADVAHLLQGGAPSFLLLAPLWRLARKARFARFTRVFGVVLACFAVVAVLVLFQPVRLRPFGQVAAALAAAALPPGEMFDSVLEGGGTPQIAPLVQYLRANTAPEERAAVFMYSPQTLYFSNRLAAGGVHGFAPGFFDQPDFQRQIIARLERERPPVILWDETATYDRDPERRSTVTHGLVHDFVEATYARAGKVGSHTLFRLP